MQMIYKQIYLTHRWDPKTYNDLESEWTRRVMAMRGKSTIPRSPELKPYHQMQFNVILWTPLLGDQPTVNIFYVQLTGQKPVLTC